MAISRRLDDLFRLDDLEDFQVARIWLGLDDIDARRTQSGHDEITPLDMRMRSVRARAGAASVPTEMVQLIAGMRQVELADDRCIVRRARIDIDHGERVRHLALRIEGGDVGERLGRSLGRQARRRVEGWVWRVQRIIERFPKGIFAAGSGLGKTDERSAKIPLFRA